MLVEFNNIYWVDTESICTALSVQYACLLNEYGLVLCLNTFRIFSWELNVPYTVLQGMLKKWSQNTENSKLSLTSAVSVAFKYIWETRIVKYQNGLKVILNTFYSKIWKQSFVFSMSHYHDWVSYCIFYIIYPSVV